MSKKATQPFLDEWVKILFPRWNSLTLFASADCMQRVIITNMYALSLCIV